MIILPSLARVKSAVGSPLNADIVLPRTYKGIIFNLVITASGGTTPTLSGALQFYDDAQRTYAALTYADGTTAVIFTALLTGAATEQITLYPGAGAEKTTNPGRYRALPVPRKLRVAFTYGADADESFTFSLAGLPLE